MRRHFHQNPEIGFDEHDTSRTIRTHLESQGLNVIGPIAQTGLYVDIHGKHPGPHIGYRCDIDALKMCDAKDTPYASQRAGVTHACGHDAHIAIGFGIALMLDKLRHQLHGSVRVFFQPNEEGDPSGSIPMIKAGVCDPLKAVYCIHVDPTLDTGLFGIPEGQVTASSSRLRVCIKGPSTGHSARPHQVRDTIWIATQLLNQFYQYVGRVTDARNSAVLTICMIKGGQAHNVIPTDVCFEGTLRSLHDATREHLIEYIERTVSHMAQLHDVQIDLVRVGRLPAVINDQRLCENVRACIIDLFGSESAVDISVHQYGVRRFCKLYGVASGYADSRGHPFRSDHGLSTA